MECEEPADVLGRIFGARTRGLWLHEIDCAPGLIGRGLVGVICAETLVDYLNGDAPLDNAAIDRGDAYGSSLVFVLSGGICTMDVGGGIKGVRRWFASRLGGGRGTARDVTQRDNRNEC